MGNYALYASEINTMLADNPHYTYEGNAPIADYGQCECCKGFQVNKPLYGVYEDECIRLMYCQQCKPHIELELEELERQQEAEDWLNTPMTTRQLNQDYYRAVTPRG